MTEIAFRDAPFKTSGGSTARSLNDWFGDVINVLEFDGVDPTGDTDSTAGIQAAFDLAFGPSSAPHGEVNKRLNRPVFFPAGNYAVESTLTITRVVGGLIYGAGAGSTNIFWDGTFAPDGVAILPILHINGAVGLCMERMDFGYPDGTGPFTGENSCAILLDWDGVTGEATAGNTGGGGLRFNHFINMSVSAAEFGIIIGRAAGEEGYNNLFTNVTVGGGATTLAGIDVRGPDATENAMVGGGVKACGAGAGVRCPVGGGSMHVQGGSFTGNGQPQIDFIIESGHVVHIAQLRTESEQLLKLEDGIVMVTGFTNAGYVDTIEVNGGELTIEGSNVAPSSIAEPRIFGTGGVVHISAVYGGAAYPDGLFEDYTGTVGYNPDGWTEPA